MAHDYNSILALMNLILVACAGITIVGFYRILKVFGFISGGAEKHRKMTPCGAKVESEIDFFLSNLKGAGIACIPEKKIGSRLLSSRSAAGPAGLTG